jgi:phytoene/squalene synthetase
VIYIMTTLSGATELIPPVQARQATDMAANITRAASAQTYYTIRLLADRDRAADAYRAYAYFRWLDDCIDDETCPAAERDAFLRRQQYLLEAGYRAVVTGGPPPGALCAEEQMLLDLIAHDEADSGLQVYLRNMMAVMAFDAGRRGRTVAAVELAEYTRALATAVTEALLYFIGRERTAPDDETRYRAVEGAHVIHMLRDAVEDAAVGYYNIPIEFLEARGLAAENLDDATYREWARERVALARRYFREGRAFIAGVKSRRCRLAGYAYVARFEYMAGLIERDGYRLRAAYPERKSASAGLWLVWRTISSLLGLEFGVAPVS